MLIPAVFFSVNTQEATINLSDGLHLQHHARRNASKSSKFDVLDVEFGQVCMWLLNHQPPGVDPRGDGG